MKLRPTDAVCDACAEKIPFHRTLIMSEKKYYHAGCFVHPNTPPESVMRAATVFMPHTPEGRHMEAIASGDNSAIMQAQTAVLEAKFRAVLRK